MFEYLIVDPLEDVLLQNQSGRLKGLWEHTCFEAFVAFENKKSYFEFNFSPQNAWNCFEFEDYRKPEVLKESGQFELLNMNFKNNLLRAEVRTLLDCKKGDVFDVGLCAVLEDRHHNKTFWASQHAADKPDFHFRKSFIIKAEVL